MLEAALDRVVAVQAVADGARAGDDIGGHVERPRDPRRDVLGDALEQHGTGARVRGGLAAIASGRTVGEG